MPGYSGTPLAKKLGVRDGTVLALIGAPEGFERTLGELPDGARVRRGLRGRADLFLWFVPRLRELERRAADMAARTPAGGGLWIAWPKKGSPLEADLDREDVREHGLATGLVDIKVCAVDEDWSGLRFAHRRR